MSKVRALTLAEHKRIGAELREMKCNLQSRYVIVANTIGKTKRPCRDLDRALDLIDRARSDLDDVMFRDYPAEATADFYYGG